jgi:hypothetical protein
LVKIKKPTKGSTFKGQIELTYDDSDGQNFKQNYPIDFQFHPEEQFFSGD